MNIKIKLKEKWKNYSKRMKILIIIILLTIVFFTVPRPMVLYISNQSFAEPYINVTIEVDGSKIYSEMLFVGDQHNWQKISIIVWGAIHYIEAFNNDNKISNSAIVFTPFQGYIVIDYWYYPESHYNPTPRHFSIESHLLQPQFE